MMKKLTALVSLIFASTAFAGSTKNIEVIYWDCDYASTKGLLGMGDATICSKAFEELKAQKFGGDFKLFMEWWKLNKEAEFSSRRAKDKSLT